MVSTAIRTAHLSAHSMCGANAQKSLLFGPHNRLGHWQGASSASSSLHLNRSECTRKRRYPHVILCIGATHDIRRFSRSLYAFGCTNYIALSGRRIAFTGSTVCLSLLGNNHNKCERRWCVPAMCVCARECLLECVCLYYNFCQCIYWIASANRVTFCRRRLVLLRSIGFMCAAMQYYMLDRGECSDWCGK